MANSRPDDQNGIAPQQAQDHHMPQQNSVRPFGLNEALPYTPFTSVFPFEPDIINNPTIGSGPLAPSVAGLVSQEDYDALNSEAEYPNSSRRLEGSLEYLQNLLKPEKITHFQFKTAPKANAASINAPSKSLVDGLSPFAKMVYDNTAIGFQFPTPNTTPKVQTPKGQNTSPRITKRSPKARKLEPPKVVKHNPAVVNAQAVAKNKCRIEIQLPSIKQMSAGYTSPQSGGQISVSSQSPQTLPNTVSPADLTVTPRAQSRTLPLVPAPQLHQAPPEGLPQVTQQTLPPTVSEGFSKSASQERRLVGIRIELPAAGFNRDEYVVVDDSANAPAHLSSKKRKRAESGDGDELLDGGLNNRERSHAALRELQKCVQEVFEAEDRGQTNYSSHWITFTADQEPTMTVATQMKVQKLITKTIDLGCFRLVPVEDLRRIQILCDGSLKHAESLDVKFDETWGEVDVTMWLQQLPDIETGLKAARTALTVMSGGREDKQLYSEDLIQQGLNLFRNVMDGIIVPLAELHSSGSKTKNNLLKLLSAQKKPIGTVFTACQKLFALMCTLITTIDLSDTVVGTLEACSSRLIFVDNAHSESTSVVGVQKFDGLRLVAMDMLSQIFLKNESQRQGIFDDILTSLEKLPTTKQSARQFKLSDGGKAIQPVSALIMRLVQASAGKVDDHKARTRGHMMQSLEDNANGNRDEKVNCMSGLAATSYAVKTEDSAAIQHSTAIQELESLAPPLFNRAKRNAAYVVNFLVKRAQKSTKSGESPYRKLLDMFVEDFASCLDSPDWPAAELLLRLLMFMMLELVRNEKTAAPAKNMALELLGTMAAAISKLRSHVRKAATGFEGSDSDELGRWLADLTSLVLERKFSPEKITSWLGPYRVILEYLEGRVNDDPHLRSAISYLVTTWGSELCVAYDDETQEESEERDSEIGRTAYRLRNMVEDRRWLTNEYSFKTVAVTHAKLSHSILLLRSQFCDYFQGILNILMQSMTTDAATVRSRSLKSINEVLDTDPTLLDGDSVVIQLILQCSNDSSPQVRDSALGLVGKCISMRPNLEEDLTLTVIDRFKDTGVGVRKRAMKLARDIYLGNQNKRVRSAIISALLLRMSDPDEGVRELARQMIEEVWIAPFFKANDSTAYKQSLTDHVALMVQTVKQGNASLILDKVFQTILSPESKLAEANSQVCKRLVVNIFDLVDNPDSDDPLVPSGKDALQLLMIFAKADPNLFTFEQVRLLQPRVASVSTNEDGVTSKAVVAIYRRVLPHVSTVHSQFLSDVRRELMPAVSKVARVLLDDVIACLWTIGGLLGSSEHIARLVSSSLVAMTKVRAVARKGPLDNNTIRRIERYSLIIGMVGKNCDLDDHAALFRPSFPNWQGDSVSKLMVDVLVPFANPSQPEVVRKSTLDAIGLVCQSKPRNYVAANVYTTFQQVFDEQVPALEFIILRSFKEFLLTEERRSELAAASATGIKEKEPAKKDLKSMGSTGFDDVASATTQRFLKDITRITLATQDEHALLAMEVLASISRQGLVHPKETGVTLITLETCPMTKISELAYQEHRGLHEKHETVIEREYVKAVQSSFQYARNITKDPRGATTDPFTSKLNLLIQVLKISKPKNRQRFLEKFVGQLDFEPNKLEVDQPLPPQVEFSRFLAENLAFFDYVSVGDLQTTVTALEKLVASIGSGIAQSIESEIFQVNLATALSEPATYEGAQSVAQAESPVDVQRLRQLTAGSMILLAVWEARTYLRRQYSFNSNRRESKGKAASKDLTKAPVRVQAVTGDKFWEDITSIMTGLESQERMIETCKALVELLSVDKEFKIAEEEEDDDVEGDEEPRTPEGNDDEEDAPNSNPRGRKRKGASTPGGKAKRARSSSKQRGRGRPRKNHAAESDDGDDDEIF